MVRYGGKMSVRRCPSHELFEHRSRHKPPCSGSWVVRLIPLPVTNIADDVKEIALLEGELLWRGGFVALKGTNDFLWRLNGL